jgi:uncharacterized RDD family membrane protein YckC
MADYASVGSRIVAILLDHLILVIFAAIIALPLGLRAALFSLPVRGPAGLMRGAVLPLGALNFLLWLLYFTYFEGTSGQTLGKRIMGIKVVKEGGEQLTPIEAFIRTIFRIIDGFVLYLIGFILIMVSEKKQRLGDMAACTARSAACCSCLHLNSPKGNEILKGVSTNE